MVFLSSCTSPNVNVNNYTLSIAFENKRTINAYGSKSFQRQIDLSNIKIYQYVYTMDNGLIITYEDAIVAAKYKLNYGMSKIIDIIFTDYNVKKINYNGNTYFFKLTNYHETLYLIVSNIKYKRLKLIYGFNRKTFESLYNAIINGNDNIILKKLTKNKRVLVANPVSYINSSWNQKNITLDRILTKTSPSLYK